MFVGEKRRWKVSEHSNSERAAKESYFRPKTFHISYASIEFKILTKKQDERSICNLYCNAAENFRLSEVE